MSSLPSLDTTPMPRAPDRKDFRLRGDADSLMTPDEHRVAAALLREEASVHGDGAAAVLATIHSVLAEALQLRIDEQCPPIAPQ